MLFRRRHLLLGLAVCAVLQALSVRTRPIVPALTELAVVAEGSFEPGGQHPSDPFVDAVAVRSWGSWSGSDENLGTLVIGPFAAPRVLRFALAGYPARAGNSVRIELVGTAEHHDVISTDVGERWRIVDVELPKAWRGRPIRIVANDASKILGGWLGISEPVRGGRGEGNNALIQSLAAWTINGVLLALLASASYGLVVARARLASHWKPLAIGAVIATIGYVAFWAYFWHAHVGLVFSCSVLLAAGVFTVWPRRDTRAAGTGPTLTEDGSLPSNEDLRAQQRNERTEITTVLRLAAVVGFFHLTLLHLFPTQHDFYALGANRYREAMPSDNYLPHTTAERLFAAESLKNPIDEWLSSDRPPLQAGWLLTTWPVSKALQLDRRTASGTSAVWFQLLWVAGAYGLLRALALEHTRAAGWVAALALCGFFLQNTAYTWPKLAAAAFACGTFALLVLEGPRFTTRSTVTWAAGFAGLAWLAHGSVAFSFLALVPLMARQLWRQRRELIPTAVVVLVLLGPWIAYQRWYDPPANRLFKWHLAGQSERDPRGTWETLRESYAQLGWREAWANKVSNLHVQIIGNWKDLADVSRENAAERRRIEFFHAGRALTWWPVAALLLLVITRRAWASSGRDLVLLGGWVALTVIVWCLLLFGRYQAVIHHGSYAMMIGAFALCSVMIDRAGPRWFAIVAGLQAVTLETTWAVGNATVHGPPSGFWWVMAAAALLAGFIARAVLSLPVTTAPAPRINDPGTTTVVRPDMGARAMNAFQRWWQNPTLNVWVLAALALLLALRKPHALHTPQLWAEDGSIFLMQADLQGVSAIITPYMGYLHALPRAIAWLAPKLLDPAWWPHFYNGVAFTLWLAVLARFFTSRFDLPGKPWLVLAFVAVPHSGEVLFNVTNLQWLMGFVLIQQAIILPARNAMQRFGDRLILALVTFTGPFGVVFLPLFAWRWWRDRSRDNTWLFAVVLLGAAVQTWLVIRTGPRFGFQAEPWQPVPIFLVLARRLVAWPLLGRDVALGLAPAAVAALGVIGLVLLPLWALRPHPHRLRRLQIVAAAGLILAAGVYRVRPDTWAADNLDFGDRYFYIPRVLLAWLVIWEFHAVPRAMAILARISGLVVALMQLRDYSVSAPPNYRWAEHVEPIRRGVPAHIPILPEGWTLDYRGRPNKP